MRWSRPYVGAYFFPGTPDGRPNRPIIETALPKLEAQFGMLDHALAKTGHFVGRTFTLADMNVLPMLFYLHHLPESGMMLRRNANLAAFYERHIARASVTSSELVIVMVLSAALDANSVTSSDQLTVTV